MGRAMSGSALADADVFGALFGAGVERAVPHEPGQGPDRACRSRSTSRPRPATTRITRWRGARSARSVCRCRTSGDARRSSTESPRGDEHLDDDQRDGDVAVRHVPRARGGTGCRPARCSPAPRRTTSSRSTCRAARTSSGPSRRVASPSTSSATRCSTCRSGTRSTCARTTCRKRARRRSKEIAYALATAIGVLDAVRESGRSATTSSPKWSGASRSSSNAGIRFVEEMCKLRAFARLWDRIWRERYGVTDAKLRRFRYGVQVNSLGLTEAQPENNVQRIVLETLGVTLSKDARARAVQLPCVERGARAARARGTSSGRCGSSRCSRYETDLLEYDDLFAGSRVVEAKTAELADAADAELALGARRRRRVRDDRRDEGPARAEPRRTGAPHRVG